MPDAETQHRVPTPGRIVLYKLPDGPHRGEYRPAIVVKVWTTDPPFTSQLQVFTDGSNDGVEYGLHPVAWKTSVVHGDGFGEWIGPQVAGQGHPHHAASAEGAE